MFKKVHFILGIFVALYFLPSVTHKVVFFPMVLLASIIPDLDSIIFPKKIPKFLNAMKSPNYSFFMHSYTLCIILSALLVFFYPTLALPFFIGYSFHLFFDSLTTFGTMPFWPLKIRTKGIISPEGIAEKTITLILIILSTLLILKYLFLI